MTAQKSKTQMKVFIHEDKEPKLIQAPNVEKILEIISKQLDLLLPLLETRILIPESTNIIIKDIESP